MSMFRKVFKLADEKEKEDRVDIKNIEYKRKIDPLFRDPCGKGHLHILLQHGYDIPEDVDYVLSCGCEINMADNDNNYPIHIAVSRALNKCVKKLIQRNSLLDVFNNDDVTPLMIAAQKRHADNLYNLLQNGANPNLSNKIKRSAMHYAAIGGDVRCFKLLLEARGKVNHQDEQGFPPLILAAKAGHLDIVKCLLEYNSFPKTNPNKQDNEKRTALHWAVEKGHFDIVRILMEHKVDADVPDIGHNTPFGRALMCNQPEILQLLIENGCDRGLLDGLNGTCLGLAALFGFEKCLKVLLDSGESADEVAYFGITPLMAAVFESQVEATRVLIEGGASVDMLGRTGTHALPLTFLNLGPRNETARHDIVRMLLRAGSHPNLKLSPSCGPCAVYLGGLAGGRYDMLSFAMLSGYVSMATMLLIAGSRVTKSDVEVLSSNAFLIRGFFVSHEMIDTLKSWVEQPSSLKQITRHCIRNSLGYNTQTKIKSLPIASPLKKFLDLEELDYIGSERRNNRLITFSASDFVSITPCGLSALSGSLLHSTTTPSVGLCNCPYCKKYEESSGLY